MKSLPPVSCRTTSTGAFALPAMALPPDALGELVLARREDELQHAAYARGAPLALVVRAEAEPTLLGRGLDQDAARLVTELERADQLEAAVDELLGRERAGRAGAPAQPVDELPQAGLLRVGDLVDGEVDPLVERAAVDPLLAGVPALDGRRVEDLLAHRDRGLLQLEQAGLGEAGRPHQRDGPDDQLGRALEPARARGLEALGVEEDAQHRA